MRNTYEDLPKIAALIGWEKDEYGEYNLKYNADLLSQHFVFPKEQFHMDNALEALAFPIMFLFLAVLVVGLFVLIIHNAFSLSANSRVTQLGILQASALSPPDPAVVIWEGLFLMLLPLPADLPQGGFWIIG